MGDWLDKNGGPGKAGRLLSLMAGAALAVSAGNSMAGQSSSLGVGVKVVRSCRINTIDVISSAGANSDVLRDSRPVQCGKAIPPVVSISPAPIADLASTGMPGNLTVTLSY